MIRKPQIEKQIADMAFELGESKGPKLLFALSDSDGLRRQLIKEIDSRTGNASSASSKISVRSASDNIYKAIKAQSEEGSASAIHLVGFERLSSPTLAHLFGDLNFHRDALLGLGVPIVFWLPPRLLSRLIAQSPDLWSRRGGVYHFSETNTKTFLKRLFTQASPESKKWKPEPILSEAFKKIFAAEKVLSHCLHDRKSFSLPKVDGLLSKITAGLDTLGHECRRGRQIEVALWVWNFSHLDAQLQSMLDKLEQDQRVTYESLYTDRNEALLYLSKKLPDILQRYRDSLGENINLKRRVSLLERTRESAISQLARMARALERPAEIPVPFGPEFDNYLGGQLEFFQSPDTLFLQKAARELEEWLVGISKTGPRFLSSDEAELLKLLYMNPGRTALVAKLAKLPLREAKEKLKTVETKVSLYLGLPAPLSSPKPRREPAKRSRPAA